MTFLFPEAGLSQSVYNEAHLLKRLSEVKTDKERVDCMITFVKKASNHDNHKVLDYGLEAIDLAKKIHYTDGLLAAYEAIGDAYWYRYDYATSIDYYLMELRLADSLNIPSRKAKANYNIGWIKCVQQEMFQERGKLISSFRVFDRLRDTASVLQVLNALASTYQTHSADHPEYLDSAVYYFRNMVFLAENSTFKSGLTTIYQNYATFMMEQKKYHEALKYTHKSLQKTIADGDTFANLASRLVLANIYSRTDSLQKAKALLDDMEGILEAKNYKSNLLDVYKIYSKIYKEQGDFEKALAYHEKFKELNDSLNIKVFKSNLQEKESAYEMSKKENDIRRLEQINELSELKNKQNRFIIIGLGLGVLLIVGFAYNLYKSNKNKQLANQLLSKQNKIIADKKQEIDQSIHYAKGIQTAILPSVDELKRALPDSFVIYLPKDVVSGDFYWFHPLPQEGQLLVAAADCTGHGVPGSLMSIVSIDKLNHAIFEKRLTRPGEILTSINNEIKNALKQNAGAYQQKDGLDIALLRVDLVTSTLTYAGANRPLWIIRDGEVIEYKATKTSIAGHTGLNQEFTEHIVPVHKHDLVLIFSDGYADQFGGVEGKKMMTRNFKLNLAGLSKKPVKDIETTLVKGFHDWKGNHEQVDDVLVIGFKI
jgi:serine phosphatase RsbU (regulator of sigma subunit)